MIEIKNPKELTNLDLLELVCQLHSRVLEFASKEMHDAYIEARQELEARLEQKLNKHGVVGQSEQLKCDVCGFYYDKEEIEMFWGLCESCRDRAF